MINKIKKFKKDESGQALIFVTVLLLLLLGMSAWALDGGRLYYLQNHYQNITNLAAHSGAIAMKNYDTKNIKPADTAISDMINHIINESTTDNPDFGRNPGTNTSAFTHKAVQYGNVGKVAVNFKYETPTIFAGIFGTPKNNIDVVSTVYVAIKPSIESYISDYKTIEQIIYALGGNTPETILNVGDEYTLPATLWVLLSKNQNDESTFEFIPVTWEPNTVNTTQTGDYIFIGELDPSAFGYILDTRPKVIKHISVR